MRIAAPQTAVDEPVVSLCAPNATSRVRTTGAGGLDRSRTSLAFARKGGYHGAMRSRRTSSFVLLAAALLLACSAAGAAQAPARKAVEHCAWERLADAKLGLAAWVQRCDFGFRRIDFVAQGDALAIRYSDGGGAPDPVVDVLGLEPGETPEAGVKRIFADRTDAALAKRCVIAPWKQGRTPAGRVRYTFVPDANYRKELRKTASPDEVGEPPCGPYGESPDGVQYFETQPKSRVARVLFVRVGQDEPLFDTQTLELLPSP